MQLTPIFHFEDPIQFIQSQLESKKKRNPLFSLRAWSRQLGYRNPSYLAQVMKRQRRLTQGLAEKLSQNLKLDQSSQNYFHLLVQIENCQTDREKSVLLELLKKTPRAPRRSPREIHLSQFQKISHWLHWAILEATQLKDFNGSRQDLKSRIRSKVSNRQFNEAVDRLLDLGLLSLEEGCLKRMSDPVLTDPEIPASTIRNYHKQMIHLGTKAIEEQTLEERFLRASTVCLQKDDLIKVQELLKELHEKTVHLSLKEQGDFVYQLNTQLFQLAKGGAIS